MSKLIPLEPRHNPFPVYESAADFFLKTGQRAYWNPALAPRTWAVPPALYNGGAIFWAMPEALPGSQGFVPAESLLQWTMYPELLTPNLPHFAGIEQPTNYTTPWSDRNLIHMPGGELLPVAVSRMNSSGNVLPVDARDTFITEEEARALFDRLNAAANVEPIRRVNNFRPWTPFGWQYVFDDGNVPASLRKRAWAANDGTGRLINLGSLFAKINRAGTEIVTAQLDPAKKTLVPTKRPTGALQWTQDNGWVYVLHVTLALDHTESNFADYELTKAQWRSKAYATQPVSLLSDERLYIKQTSLMGTTLMVAKGPGEPEQASDNSNGAGVGTSTQLDRIENKVDALTQLVKSATGQQ